MRKVERPYLVLIQSLASNCGPDEVSLIEDKLAWKDVFLNQYFSSPSTFMAGFTEWLSCITGFRRVLRFLEESRNGGKKDIKKWAGKRATCAACPTQRSRRRKLEGRRRLLRVMRSLLTRRHDDSNRFFCVSPSFYLVSVWHLSLGLFNSLASPDPRGVLWDFEGHSQDFNDLSGLFMFSYGLADSGARIFIGVDRIWTEFRAKVLGACLPNCIRFPALLDSREILSLMCLPPRLDTAREFLFTRLHFTLSGFLSGPTGFREDSYPFFLCWRTTPRCQRVPRWWKPITRAKSGVGEWTSRFT